MVKKSESSNLILNGRAALCAGKDDMSSEDEHHEDNDNHKKTTSSAHRFAKPDNFKTVLESGAIPDAAMIHAARKRRQKAREEGITAENNTVQLHSTHHSFATGDFVPIEEKPVNNRKGRLVREDGDDDGSDDEQRVDMSAINGAKEREERREKFYSVQQECKNPAKFLYSSGFDSFLLLSS